MANKSLLGVRLLPAAPLLPKVGAKALNGLVFDAGGVGVEAYAPNNPGVCDVGIGDEEPVEIPDMPGVGFNPPKIEPEAVVSFVIFGEPNPLLVADGVRDRDGVGVLQTPFKGV